MANRIRIGIAGVGFAGKFHRENFPEGAVEVVGVTLLRARRKVENAFAAQHGVRAFASVAEMLPEIDVLDICTPPSSHNGRQYILEAAAATASTSSWKSRLRGSTDRLSITARRKCSPAWWRNPASYGMAVRSAGNSILGYAENFPLLITLPLLDPEGSVRLSKKLRRRS